VRSALDASRAPCSAISFTAAIAWDLSEWHTRHVPCGGGRARGCGDEEEDQRGGAAASAAGLGHAVGEARHLEGQGAGGCECFKGVREVTS